MSGSHINLVILIFMNVLGLSKVKVAQVLLANLEVHSLRFPELAVCLRCHYPKSR